MRKILLLGLAALLTPLFLFAQGTISGTIIDQNSAEPLIGANVVLDGTAIGASTDFDGKYQFAVDPGVYTIAVSYTGYENKKITEVNVKDGEITYLDVTLSDEAVDLGLDVVVTAQAIERSENALLLLQKKSDKIQDGISSQEMSRYSVGDAAGAMQKVTGATVSGGKYIYIRGLGDRYSLSQLNGLIMPSSDPYRNGAQLDLIPSNLLDNIITSKTATPDLPGTFTGGNVDIRTKSFPEQFSLTVSVSGSYNSQNNLVDNFLTHQGGSTDYWGYNDGSRDRPAILDDPAIRDVLNTQTPLLARLNYQKRGQEIATAADQAIRAMDMNFVPAETTTPIDHGASIAYGNSHDFLGGTLGVIMSASFSQQYQQLYQFERANWRLEDLSQGNLFNQGDFRETLSTQNPTVNGLLGLAYKFSPMHSVNFNVIYNHNTTKSTRFVEGERPDNIIFPDFLEGRSMVFNERGLTAYQLGGEHMFEALNKAKVEWKVSTSQSSLFEPNTRFFENQYNIEFDISSIPASNIQRPFYFYRDLADEQVDAKLDFTLPFSQNNANKIKFGTLITQKDRTFKEWRYQIEEHVGYTDEFLGDVEAYLDPSNIGIVNVDDQRGRYYLGNYLVNRSLPGNNYTGSDDVTAFYGMITLAVTPKLKFIGGARYEKTELRAESEDPNREAGNIDEENILPSANFVYSLSENMNIRAAYSQTLARPNMREMAPFEGFDPITKEIYIGNPNLDKTDIQNFDLRWEWYVTPGELIAVSAYYKDFTNPITQIYRRAPNPEIQFVNVGGASLYGLELELRKNLGFLGAGAFFQNLKFSSNFSVIESTMDVVDLTGLEPENRPFEGQPSFILNAALIYSDVDHGWDATLALNSLGDRLNIIGREGTPDIYDRGRNQLDFTLIKKIGDLNLKLTAQNILDSPFVVSSDYLGREYVYSRFNRGITFGTGVSYTIR
jgi:TonB-dependent receptor